MAIRTVGGALKRGALARRHGCHVETIRYYEAIELLPPPDRTASGHRLYSEEHQARLRFILRARELGFSVEQVRSLAELERMPDERCSKTLALTERHLADVRAKIRDLRRLEESLLALSGKCSAGSGSDCPIVEALLDEG